MQHQTPASMGIKLIKDIGKPLFVPQDRSELARLPAAVLKAVGPEVLADVEDFLREPGAEAFRKLEESVLDTLPLAASHVVAGVVALLHPDPAWVAAAVGAARESAFPAHWGRLIHGIYLRASPFTLNTPWIYQAYGGSPCDDTDSSRFAFPEPAGLDRIRSRVVDSILRLRQR